MASDLTAAPGGQIGVMQSLPCVIAVPEATSHPYYSTRTQGCDNTCIIASWWRRLVVTSCIDMWIL